MKPIKKIKKKKKPTIRQAEAIKKIVESRGKKSIGKAMRESGYSPKTAKNPKNLTESKSWEELMEEYLPDKSLMKLHERLLDSKNIDKMSFPKAIKDKEIIELLASVNCVARKMIHGKTETNCWFWSPNDKSRKEALDMAYKLKGKYVEKVDLTSGGKSLDFTWKQPLPPNP